MKMICKGKTLGTSMVPTDCEIPIKKRFGFSLSNVHLLSLTSLPSPTFLFSTLIWCFRFVSGRHRVGDRPLKSMSSHFASNSELASVFPKKSTGMWQESPPVCGEKTHWYVAEKSTGVWQKSPLVCGKKVHRCVAKKSTGMWQKSPPMCGEKSPLVCGKKGPQEGGKDHWFGDLVALWPSAAFI